MSWDRMDLVEHPFVEADARAGRVATMPGTASPLQRIEMPSFMQLRGRSDRPAPRANADAASRPYGNAASN